MRPAEAVARNYTPFAAPGGCATIKPMRQFVVRVAEVARQASGAVRVKARGAAPPFAPGQAALAYAAVPGQPFLREALYPFRSTPGGFNFVVTGSHPYAALAPDETLDVLGPVGRGFELPPRAGRLLLAAAEPGRLLALLDWALERGWAVTLWQPPGAPPPEVPEAVEVQRGELDADLLAWADVVALDLPGPARWAADLRARQPGRAAGYVWTLAETPMPCGTGACQGCWTETGHGRHLACVDGPALKW